MSEKMINIPDSSGFQITERSITTSENSLDIEGEIVDIKAIIEKRIKDNGAYSLEGCEQEYGRQASFQNRAKILFKILRTFPNNTFALSRLEMLISKEHLPWRILAYAEQIPEDYHKRIIQKFGRYLEENEKEIYGKLELAESIGKQLQHISCYPELQNLLKALIAVIPSSIAYQILCGWNYYNDELEKSLICRATLFSNRMTEEQKSIFTKRVNFSQSASINEVHIPKEILIPSEGTILQLFHDDVDGYRSFKHFHTMMLTQKFKHTENGGIHEYSNGKLHIITYNPIAGNNDNIKYFIEHQIGEIDICVIRGHTGRIDIAGLLEICPARIVFVGGCESSKYIRKDVKKRLDIKGNTNAIKERVFIVAKNIGTMHMNDTLIEMIIQSSENNTPIRTTEINRISKGDYEVFSIL